MQEEKKETEAFKRGKEFCANFNLDKNNEKGKPKKKSSGFWMTNLQLTELALDLEKQGSEGIGFMVGCRNNNKKDGKIFSVEIVPLKSIKKGFELSTNIKLKEDLSDEEIEIPEIEGIKGKINTKVPIIHLDKFSKEGQRFPPPFPED